ADALSRREARAARAARRDSSLRDDSAFSRARARMSFEVRRAVPADVDALVAFNHAMAAESEDKTLDLERLRAGIETLLAHPDEGYYLIAWSLENNARERAGALMLTFEWSDWRNGRFWWIQSVYVPPRWRRRGVYSALHAHVRDAARADPQACGLRLY